MIMDKSSLRKYIREQKRHFLQRELEEMSFCISSKIMQCQEVIDAKRIMMYYPLPDEVNISSLLDELCDRGKEIYLPKVISDEEMSIHRYNGKESLEIGAFGILEPVGDKIGKEILDSIEVAIVPGMAFDRYGNRLGRGKGYYDRFLSLVPNIYTIGVCFPFQIVDVVPSNENDVAMKIVLA